MVNKHGSCLEKKLLRKERDGNCTKATVVRTSVVPTAMKDTHRMTSLSTKGTRDEGSQSRSAQSEHGKTFPAGVFQKLGSWQLTIGH